MRWLDVLLHVEVGSKSAKHNNVVGSGSFSCGSNGRSRTAAFCRPFAIAQNAEPLPQGCKAQVLLRAALRRVLVEFLESCVFVYEGTIPRRGQTAPGDLRPSMLCFPSRRNLQALVCLGAPAGEGLQVLPGIGGCLVLWPVCLAFPPDRTPSRNVDPYSPYSALQPPLKPS